MFDAARLQRTKNKEQSTKHKAGIPCGDDLVKCSSSGLSRRRLNDAVVTLSRSDDRQFPSGLTLRVLWPRRESSRARPRPHLAFRRSALLLPSGLTLRVLWPRRESSRARPRPHLAFRRGALLLPSGWPRRESSRARPRPSLAFRRSALLLPSGWPQRESNPHLAFRKRLFYPLNYSANISTLYSIISSL